MLVASETHNPYLGCSIYFNLYGVSLSFKNWLEEYQLRLNKSTANKRVTSQNMSRPEPCIQLL